MTEFLIGKNIHLRGLRREEIFEGTPYYRWLNDLSLDVFTERSYFPNTPERMEAYFNHAQQHQEAFLLGIFDNETGKHIGNIGYNQINQLQRRAFIAYLLGDKTFAGRGVITQAVLMFMYYGFNKLNYDRIHGGVSEAHEASVRICEKVGLLVEGRQRKHVMRNGERFDVLIVGALRDEWMESHGEKARDCFAELPT